MRLRPALMLTVALWLLGAAGASALVWSAPRDPSRPFAPYDETAAACVGDAQCLVTGGGADGAGGPARVFATTDAAVANPRWRTVLDAPGGDTQLDTLACPGVSLCLAGAVNLGGGAPGRLATSYRSETPTSGGWQVASLGDGVSSITCPSIAFCAAGLQDGQTLSTADPDTPIAGWSRGATLADDGAEVVLACPTATLCVAVDSDGAVHATTTPASAEPWSRVLIGRTDDWKALSCAGPDLCAAGGLAERHDRDALMTTTRPADPHAWRLSMLRGSTRSPSEPDAFDGVSGVACPRISECVAVDAHGRVLASTDPTAARPRWRIVTRLPIQLNAVACTAGLVCVAAGDDARVAVSSDPTGRWRLRRLDDGYDPLTGALCTGAQRCTAVDTHGNVLRLVGGRHWTTSPGHNRSIPGSPGWRAPTFSGAFACVGRSLCLAGGPRRIAWTRHLRQPLTSWHEVALGIGHGWAGWADDVSGLSCPSTRLCVGVDGLGDILASTRPTGPAAGWRVLRRAPGGCDVQGDGPNPCGLAQVSCPSMGLCVAAGDPGGLLVSTAPDRMHSWRVTGTTLAQVQCPRRSLCLGVPATPAQLAGLRQGPGVGGALASGEPRIAVSHAPTGGARAWSSFAIPGLARIKALSCVGERLCAVVGVGTDGRGTVAVSRTPTTPASWTLTAIGAQPMDGVRCFAGPVCVAWDAQGAFTVAR